MELNTISEDVTEQVIKGNIQIVKHIDREDTDESLNTDPDNSTMEEDTSAQVSEPVSVSEQTPTSEEISETKQEPVPTEDAAVATQSDAVPDSENSEDAQSSEESFPDDIASGSEDTEIPDEGTTDETETVIEIPEELQPVPVPEEDIESASGDSMIEQPEEGAKFQIFLASAGSYDAAKESERDILVTDADGFAQSKDLPYGIDVYKRQQMRKCCV